MSLLDGTVVLSGLWAYFTAGVAAGLALVLALIAFLTREDPRR